MTSSRRREPVMQLAATSRLEPRLAPATVVTGALAASALAWVVLIDRMAGMDTGPGGDPGSLGWFAVTWALMTAAMMLPAAAPALSRLARARPSRAPAGAALFVAGYGAVWVLAGLAGYAVVEAIRGFQLGVFSWSSAGRYVAGATVLVAGLYQLTDVKRRWLARCVTPDLHRSARRSAGPLLAGLEHGRCCVACCWALMVALYAVGMMSIAWMAVITVLIVGERLAPRPVVVRTVGAVLIVLGLGVAVWPAVVPALTIPPGHTMAMGMRGAAMP